ncbi:MAG: response regulator [Planctomycetota bacterium]|jgi:PAS domain S-box-containing protein|nr:response regulator [Planctomycetota bacterium]
MRNPAKYSILIVDDESADLAVLSRILAADNVIFTAKNGAQALAFARANRLDLILLDIMMPEMSGFEVLLKLKQSPETVDIPVIFITGLTGADDEEKGFGLGAVDYITKPFKPVAVKARVATHLKYAHRLFDAEDNLSRISVVVENSPESVLFIDANGNLEYTNPATAEISGYSRADIYAQGLGLILADYDWEKLRRDYIPATLEKRRCDFDLRINRPDGDARLLAASAFAASLHHGDLGIGIIARDETEKKLRQEELTAAKVRVENALTETEFSRQEAMTEAKIRIENARREAEFYRQAKSNFLSRMSHEMRTPLNAIIGNLAVARAAADGRRDDCFDRMEENARNILTLVNNLLDMSHLDAGTFILSPREFNFREMLDGVGKTLAARVKAKSLAWTLAVDPNIPEALAADEKRLGQVLLNLLSNAVKFTAAGGTVGVAATLQEQNDEDCVIRFEVSDTGRGISDESQRRLFQAFEQADNSITRAHGGSGLDLAIAHGIIKMMGGGICVESEIGKGARFIFTVRAAKAEDDFWNRAELNLAGKRLLVVDDVETNREILLTMLGGYGATLEHAENGDEAVRLFAERGYDLILMDLHMPEMDGIEAARRIRALVGDAVPIIAVTADTNKDIRRRCMEAGMNDFIDKPIDFTVAFAALRRHLLHEREFSRAGALLRPAE